MSEREIRGAEFSRTFGIDLEDLVRNDDGEATRELWVAASSEEPYERWFGPEVLVHEKGSINMEFLGGGRAPVLDQHNHGQQVGVIEEVKLGSDKVLRARLRFGKSAKATELYDDVLDGIRANVSIGYRINNYEEIKDKRGNVTEFRVTDWLPYEVSMVSVPADMTVGVGRSAETQSKPKGTRSMDDPVVPAVPVDTDAIRREATEAATRAAAADAAAAAQTRNAEVAEMLELGALHNMTTEAAAAVRAGGSLSELRGTVLAALGDDAPLAPNGDVGLNQREIADFSIFNLLRASVPGATNADREAASLEREAVNAAIDAAEETPHGFLLPNEVMRNFMTPEMQRTLLAGTDTQLIPTEHRAQSFIELLRASATIMRAGARSLPGLSGLVDIPRMATSAGATWISAEHGDSTDGEPTFDTVSLAPKDISVSVPMSRRMRQQSSPAIEGLVRMDIVASMGLGIDLGGLEGTNSNGQPKGVLNQTGIATPTAFAGVNPTWAEAVAMETAIANANALTGSLGYIGRTNMYGALKTVSKDAGSGQYVIEPGGTLNGYAYHKSNQITDGNLYFGNWADVLIGLWGGLDLVFDDATLAAKNGLYIRAFQTVDVAVRHGASFAVNNDGV